MGLDLSKLQVYFRFLKKHSSASVCILDLHLSCTRDFQQCGILTSVDSDEPVQPPFMLRDSKWCSVNSVTIIEYSSDKQRLWSDCAYAQAYLRLCWWHIPHCWKSYALAQLVWIVWLLTNELFKYSADTLKCEFLTIPDWLKFRKEKRYHKAASGLKNKKLLLKGHYF